MQPTVTSFVFAAADAIDAAAFPAALSSDSGFDRGPRNGQNPSQDIDQESIRTHGPYAACQSLSIPGDDGVRASLRPSAAGSCDLTQEWAWEAADGPGPDDPFKEDWASWAGRGPGPDAAQ